jgi:hypothetical protein
MKNSASARIMPGSTDSGKLLLRCVVVVWRLSTLVARSLNRAFIEYTPRHRAASPSNMPHTDVGVDMIDFWGVKVPAKGSVKVKVTDNESEFEIIHVTNVALGPKPSGDAHPVSITHEGEEIVLGTLKQGSAYQFALDFGCTKSFTLSNHGSSIVHFAGFKTRSVIEDMSDDEYELEDSEEEPPMAVGVDRKVTSATCTLMPACSSISPSRCRSLSM